MASSRSVLRSLPLLLLPLTFSCSAQDAVEAKAPVEETTTPASHHHNDRFVPLPPVPPLPEGWTVLECGYTNRKTARITPSGGVVGIDVAALAIFPRTLNETVRFYLTESETRVEALIEAEDGRSHFPVPLELIMSFTRCGPNYHAVPGRRLAIWRYRQETGWQMLGGQVDNMNQTIRTGITEFSRVAVGEGRSN
jgi:hypothetical protein